MNATIETKKVSLRGKELLRNPLLNKGTAFTEEEREMFQLKGLLPHGISSMHEQLKRRYINFKQKTSHIGRYRCLMDLQNRNETLFYRFCLEHIEEMLPYVYTPTVGDAALAFSNDFHTSRGLFISPEDDNIEEILRNCGQPDIDVIVVTDGSRILGLGDVGVGGIVIPIGKLALYTLFGGVNPERTLPIFLDVGTNNKELRRDPLYVGKRNGRIKGDDYIHFIDRFVQAVKNVYPKVMLQWEDFEKEHAYTLLERYRDEICSFNDDIEGTATVTLAGLLSALKLKGETFLEQKIVIYGAGSAGLGIANLIVDYLTYHKIPRERAYSLIYLIDRNGLVHENSHTLREELKPFAKTPDECDEWKDREGNIPLERLMNHLPTTILIGVSTDAGAFTKSIVKKMLANTSRPVIFPLSNPNSKSEAKPADLIKWTKGRAIVATGSPYEPVKYRREIHQTYQCNNVYVFPAFGLASATVPFKKIDQTMFIAAAEILSEHSLPNLFPTFKQLREVSILMAKKIIEVANEQGYVEKMPSGSLEYLLEASQYYPNYSLLTLK